MTRYAVMTGHRCQRRFGWDCHGLPIEYEIDKRYAIKSSAEREAVSTIPLTFNLVCFRLVSLNTIADAERLS
jgi:isoleucyl-tRNA synthetase